MLAYKEHGIENDSDVQMLKRDIEEERKAMMKLERVDQ